MNSLYYKKPYKFQIKLLKTVKIKISIRNGHGGKEVGHASKLLNFLKSKNMPSAAQMPTGTSLECAKKTPKEMPFTEMQLEGIPFCAINPNIVNKDLSLLKIKNIVKKMIPSARPSYDPLKQPLDPRDSVVIQNKEAFMMAYNYFQNLPKEYILNTEFLATYHKELTQIHPEICVRAYQLVLEVTLNKRLYSQQEIEYIFDNKFTIRDVIGRNNGIIDTSTFFSALQTNLLYDQPGFAKNVNACVVVATCLQTGGGDLKNISPEILNYIQKSQKATGNAVNDIILNGHHYNYKLTNDPSYGKNHIMFNDANTSFEKHARRIGYTLQNEINLIKKSIERKIPDAEDLYKQKFLENSYNFLQNLIKEKNITDAAKFSILSENIYQNMHKRPQTIYMPLFISLTEKPFQSYIPLNDDVQKMALVVKKNIKAQEVTAELKVKIDTLPKETQKNIFRETQGSFGKEDVD